MEKVLFILLMLSGVSLISQDMPPDATEVWVPEPKIVTTQADHSAPSDAIVLFDGSDFNEWMHGDGTAVQWDHQEDAMVVRAGTGGIETKRKFGDFQLHLEWRSPSEVVSEGQGRGNSGVFLQKRYEVQILDSYDNRTYSNGQAASIYKQSIPLVNAMNPPGTWNTYDIIYKAPVFNADGIKISSAIVTVIHNGVVVQNHTTILGTTEYIGFPKNMAHGRDAIMLQDHGNPVAFRNIWLREL